MARNFVKVMERKSKREAKMMISATFPRPLDRRPSNSKQTACVTVTKSHLQFAVLQLPRCLRLSAVLFLFAFQLVSLLLSGSKLPLLRQQSSQAAAGAAVLGSRVSREMEGSKGGGRMAKDYLLKVSFGKQVIQYFRI